MLLAALLVALTGGGAEECAEMKDPAERLACFDALVVAADAPTECLKKALGFCLGGPAADLPPDPAAKRPDGAAYVIEGRHHFVNIVEGRVASISRVYDPGTRLEFLDTLSSLTRLYGEPEDDSSFPGYVGNDLDRQETSIRVGKGRAKKSWLVGWFSVLLWWDDGGVYLTYMHNDLISRKKPDDEEF